MLRAGGKEGNPGTAPRERAGEIYRSESRRVFATLVRLLGDLDLAEDALHNAFAAALERWPEDGVPDNPRAWLVSLGRFKAIEWATRFADVIGDVEIEIRQVVEISDLATENDRNDEGGRK